MIHFEWPWLLTALPLPLLVRWLLPANTPLEQSALKVPFLDDFSDGKTPLISKHQQWPLLLATIAWFLLIIACTRPQWLGEPIEQAVSGRDLMLAVDLSGSMEEQDFLINKNPVDRLTAIKWVASDFINRRIGDRVGLILFGTQAYLQTPLTFDRKTVLTLLNESAIGLAGPGGGNSGWGSVSPTTALANTGGGGGGAGQGTGSTSGSAGGSGIVILRYPSYLAPATSTTGSPETYVTGAWRVYRFVASGTITF